jgi:hypothetical protein
VIVTMDKFKDKMDDLKGSGIGSQLDDINFPASKDEVLRQLEQKGVPNQVLDRVREVDTGRFDSVDDLKSKVGL